MTERHTSGDEVGVSTSPLTAGPTLRLRDGHYARPSSVTLLDPGGTAWRVDDRRVAEVPDALDLPSAVFVLLLVDQLGREAGMRDSRRPALR